MRSLLAASGAVAIGLALAGAASATDTDFAQTATIDGTNYNLDLNSSGDLVSSTVAGASTASAVASEFSFYNLAGIYAPSLEAAVANQSATFKFSATPVTGTLSTTGTTVVERFNGSFSVVAASEVVIDYMGTKYYSAPGSVLLAGTFTNAVFDGTKATDVFTLDFGTGKIGRGGTIQQTLVLSSDYLSFTNATDEDMAFSVVGLSNTIGSTAGKVNPFQADASLLTAANPSPDALLYGSPTPEPASWALMIIGLGAVGGMMRRRAATKLA